MCGCESLISKPRYVRPRFRTVLESGSRLSVVAFAATASRRSAFACSMVHRSAADGRFIGATPRRFAGAPIRGIALRVVGQLARLPEPSVAGLSGLVRAVVAFVSVGFEQVSPAVCQDVERATSTVRATGQLSKWFEYEQMCGEVAIHPRASLGGIWCSRRPCVACRPHS